MYCITIMQVEKSNMIQLRGEKDVSIGDSLQLEMLTKGQEVLLTTLYRQHWLLTCHLNHLGRGPLSYQQESTT
jgi:hypothetical protein